MLEGGSGATAPRPGSSSSLHSPLRSSPLPPLTTAPRPQSAKPAFALEISPKIKGTYPGFDAHAPPQARPQITDPAESGSWWSAKVTPRQVAYEIT